MSLILTIQNISKFDALPEDKLIRKWIEQALDDKNKDAEITLRIVDEEEGKELNNTWRNKDTATNVLSFPVGEIIEQAPNMLGDIVICAPVVEREAAAQHKHIEAHLAHLVIHGTLHLQGYDHQDDDEAKIMEEKEINILKNSGYDNPYLADLQT